MNNYYNKLEINSLLSNKVINSTLTNDYYNKNSINSLLANKADKVTIETGHPSIVLTNRSDSGSATNPTYTTTYRYGHYKRIDNICFITFAIRAEITSAGQDMLLLVDYRILQWMTQGIKHWLFKI